MAFYPTFSQCIYFSSQAFARKTLQWAEDAFKPVKMPASYAYILMAVHDNQGIQAGKLSQILRLSPSTMTRLLERMERKKWLRRIHYGRVTEVQLTPSGMALYPQVKQCWMSLNADFDRVFGPLITASINRMMEDQTLALDNTHYQKDPSPALPKKRKSRSSH